MVTIFSLLGWLSIALGGLWSGSVLFARTAGPLNGMELFARLAVAWPGLGLMFSGLLLLAIGGVLSRLDKIVRNTARAAASSKELVDLDTGRREPRL